ncbi:MAG: iron-sulfur cluster assembly scaffold protein [Rhizomicrobium sp.]
MDILSMDNVFDYAEPIWQRFSKPAYAGMLTGPDVVSVEAGSPAAKSLLRIQVRWSGARIAESRFRAYGCPATIAVGEWLAENIRGKSAVELEGIGAAEIRQALEIPEDRAHCALMGEDVIRQLLKKLS